MLSDTPTTMPSAANPLLLRDLIWSFTVSQSVCTAANLGIADIVADQPKTSAEIARTLGANEPALHRLLEALTSIDLFVEDENGLFSATPTGRLLQSEQPGSQRAAAIFLGSEFIWRAWMNLNRAITSGKPSFELVHGERYFEHLANSPEDAAIFHAFSASEIRSSMWLGP